MCVMVLVFVSVREREREREGERATTGEGCKVVLFLTRSEEREKMAIFSSFSFSRIVHSRKEGNV